MKFRYARHTNQLEKLKEFYIRILGLDLLGEFKNHSGYDGSFIGKINQDWHLEFTQSQELVEHSFDKDDILVFYPENSAEYSKIIKNINSFKIPVKLAKNPYWQENGTMVQDPDGYFVQIVSEKS